MHYSQKEFSANGKDTLLWLKGKKSDMGQRKGFSDLDLKKLNKYYKCGKNKG
jgi:hypothetical protein